MATIATPRKRVRFGRKPLLIGGTVLLVLIGAGALALQRIGATATTAATTPGWQTVTASTGAIEATVNATGNVEPEAQAELRFAVDGTVTAILVQPGDEVAAGQPLARIDDTDLRLKLEQAQADLKQAQADYQLLREGATEQEIAEARARVAQAQGQYQQVAGSVTQADIAAARAKLEQAQARLARLQAGSENEQLIDARAALDQAQTQLQAKRDQLSAEKTRAYEQMLQAVSDLTKAQAAYATAKQNWEHVDTTGKDPITSFGLNDAQRREYYDTFVQAEAALHSAESAVQQAQVAYDQARQAEVTGVQLAEQEVAQAQAKLDEVLKGPTTDELAEARAAVESARAELNRLTGANRQGDLAAQQANIAVAQAALEKLMADPSASELAKAEAAVARAEAAVAQAQRDLDQATLRAPFAATVARVDLRVGEPAGPDAIITLADLSSFHVDVPVDELDVAQIREGQQVHIVLDALPDHELAGKVTNIDPLATKSDKGTNTYNVTVGIDAGNAAVRPGMTASVRIVTQDKEQAIIVPRRAVQSEQGQTFVLVPVPGQPDPRTGVPAHERRVVTLGLSNNEFVEVTSGLQAGEPVLVQDVVNTLNPFEQQ